MICAVGVEKTLAAVGEAGAGAFAGVGACMGAVVVLQAVAWAALNQPIQHKARFRTLLGAVVVGQAGNILTPSTYLGGEPLKVVYVAKATGHRYHEVAGTVLLSKYLEALSFILFFSFSTIVAAVSYRDLLFGPYLAVGVTLLGLAGASLVLFGVLWLALSRRWRPVTRLVQWLPKLRLFSKSLARLRDRASVMEDQVSRVFCEEGQAARLAFGAMLLAHAAIFAKPALFFLLGAGNGLGLGALCLIFVASQALLAFQLTPSGVGTLDGGLIGTFALVGLDEAHCMAYLLAIRFWDIAIIGGGAFLATRVGAQLVMGKGPATTDLLGADAQKDADPRASGAPTHNSSTLSS